MGTTLFTGKWAFTGDGVLENFAMLVQDGAIAAIGPQGEVKAEPGVPVVELEGYVIPGLIDCHVHLLSMGLEAQTLLAENEAVRNSAVTILGVRNAQQLLGSGVVACRDVGAINGYSLGLRKAVQNGWAPGPLVQTCGRAISATGGHGWQISYECDGEDALRHGVRQVVKDGGDVVKLMVSGGVNSPGPEPGPPEFTFEEIKAAVDAAHALGRKVAVHTHGNTAIRHCVEAGVDSIEHGVFMTEDIMDMMAERGTFLVPTLCAPFYAVAEGLRREPNNPDHLRSQSVIERHKEVVRKCAEKGVNIAFGTDAGCPFNPFDKAPFEMVLLVQAGLSAQQALRAATVNAARLMGIEKTHGSLAGGKNASFVVLEQNPLENIEAVMKASAVYLNGNAVAR